MIGEAITKILEDNAGFASAAGNAIYPLRVPQGVLLPAVTYQKISTSPNDCKGDVSRLDEIRVQLSVFAERYEQIGTIAAAIRAALDGFSGTVLNKEITGRYLTETDLFDNAGEVYHRAIDYNITIKR